MTEDVRLSMTVPSISAFSVETVSGGNSLSVLTVAVSMSLLMLNIMANFNSDNVKWPPLVNGFGYCSLIFVGLCPTSLPVNVINGITYGPRRTWNTVICCALGHKFTGALHTIAAVIFLIMPCIGNIISNWEDRNSNSAHYVFFSLSVFQLVLELVCLVTQALSVHNCGRNLWLNCIAIEERYDSFLITVEALVFIYSVSVYSAFESYLLIIANKNYQ